MVDGCCSAGRDGAAVDCGVELPTELVWLAAWLYWRRRHGTCGLGGRFNGVEGNCCRRQI
jgi:hypothetical protein